MSNEKKIKTVTTEEIKKCREEFNYSLSHARDVLKKRNIHEYIDECETVDDLKKIFHLLVERTY